MRIYKVIPHKKYLQLNGAVIALGSFDGVHRGHQKILHTGISLAKNNGKPFGVITYMPIPAMFLYRHFHFILTTDKEKIDIFKQMPIDFLGTIKFTHHIKNLDARQFITDYIINTIKPSVIVVGEDHHFGREQKGNVLMLEKLGREFEYELKIVSALKYHSSPIKSTRIRELLILGNVKRVKELLGRPYKLSGSVVKGKGLATKLGFPTLNLHIKEKEKLVPNDGVYHIQAVYQGRKYNGVMNIGFAPTIADKLDAGQVRSIEAHLLNFTMPSEPVIHKEVTIEFFDRLRPERKFDSLELLKNQIAEDIRKVKESAYL
jgi:riboflavin kinase/FMN adenylyltransferase